MIKTVWYWLKDRTESVEQNREPRNKPTLHSQLTFNKNAVNTQWGKEYLQQAVVGKLDVHMLKNEIGFSSYTIHKNQLKMD